MTNCYMITVLGRIFIVECTEDEYRAWFSKIHKDEGLCQEMVQDVRGMPIVPMTLGIIEELYLT